MISGNRDYISVFKSAPWIYVPLICDFMYIFRIHKISGHEVPSIPYFPSPCHLQTSIIPQFIQFLCHLNPQLFSHSLHTHHYTPLVPVSSLYFLQFYYRLSELGTEWRLCGLIQWSNEVLFCFLSMQTETEGMQKDGVCDQCGLGKHLQAVSRMYCGRELCFELGFGWDDIQRPLLPKSILEC